MLVSYTYIHSHAIGYSYTKFTVWTTIVIKLVFITIYASYLTVVDFEQLFFTVWL